MPKFEESIKELEKIVKALEDGEPSLDESLKSFEKGISLIKVCQKELESAENKIKELTDDGATKPFESDLQKRINSKLNSYLNSNSQIEEAIKFALSAPGKRVRPSLLYLVGDIYNISLERLDSLALASEIIHTYSLVHDDLPCMDDDDLRRGQPTLHKKYSEATAVLAGDAMQSLAIQIILEDEKLSNEHKVSK